MPIKTIPESKQSEDSEAKNQVSWSWSWARTNIRPSFCAAGNKNEPASGVSQLSKNGQFPAQIFQKILKCQNKIDKSIKTNL